MYCYRCDPRFFVVYGFCICGRRCFPPLYDPNGTMGIKDYEEFRAEWNRQRPDLIKDIMAKTNYAMRVTYERIRSDAADR